MSTAADICAGSRLPGLSTIGKLSVWSDARFSEGWLVPPPQAVTMNNVPSATARERETAMRVIPPPTKHGSRRAHLRWAVLENPSRSFPGGHGGGGGGGGGGTSG